MIKRLIVIVYFAGMFFAMQPLLLFLCIEEAFFGDLTNRMNEDNFVTINHLEDYMMAGTL